MYDFVDTQGGFACLVMLSSQRGLETPRTFCNILLLILLIYRMNAITVYLIIYGSTIIEILGQVERSGSKCPHRNCQDASRLTLAVYSDTWKEH